MIKVGEPLRGKGKSRRGNINVYLAWWFFIVLKIKLLSNQHWLVNIIKDELELLFTRDP